MAIEIWLAFVLAATLVLIIPGPTILLVMSQAIAHGRRSVLPLVAGVACGDLTAMSLSLLGLGAVLASSALLFSVLKWVGALYLLYLGISLWLSGGSQKGDMGKIAAGSNGSFFRRAYIVTALNPKGIVFFVAFMPQFVSADGNSFVQLCILGATFLFLAIINAAVYAIFAGELRTALSTGKARTILNRLGGGALIGAGVLTATLNKSS